MKIQKQDPKIEIRSSRSKNKHPRQNNINKYTKLKCKTRDSKPMVQQIYAQKTRSKKKTRPINKTKQIDPTLEISKNPNTKTKSNNTNKHKIQKTRSNIRFNDRAPKKDIEQ